MGQDLDRTIKVSTDVYQAIENDGKKGDTFDDILRRKYNLQRRAK